MPETPRPRATLPWMPLASRRAEMSAGSPSFGASPTLQKCIPRAAGSNVAPPSIGRRAGSRHDTGQDRRAETDRNILILLIFTMSSHRPAQVSGTARATAPRNPGRARFGNGILPCSPRAAPDPAVVTAQPLPGRRLRARPPRPTDRSATAWVGRGSRRGAQVRPCRGPSEPPSAGGNLDSKQRLVPINPHHTTDVIPTKNR